MEHNKHQPIVLAVICIILAVTVFVFKSRNSDSLPPEDHELKVEEIPPIIVVTEIIKKPKPFKPKYPHCIRNDSGELHDLVLNLVEDMTTCDPTEDSPTSQCPGEDSDTRGGMVVVYTAVSLLLVSLAAAAVEVWRVRHRQGSDSTPGQPSAQNPPQLSRRCSLADLTVLRHNRREFMLRRDSSMHMSFDSGNAVGPSGAQRVPLKLLGSSKSQDDGGRRASLATGKACKWQRSVSADKADENIPDVHHHRIHMIRHH